MDYNPKYLTPEQLAAALEQVGYSLEGKGRSDANGKVQPRIRSHDRSISVSFSVVPNFETAAWENAHSHHGQNEIYTILAGRIILALRSSKFGAIKFITLTAEDTFRVKKGVKHNALVFPGTVSVVSKIGEPVPCPKNAKGDDWWAAPVLDELTKKFSVAEAADRAHPLCMG